MGFFGGKKKKKAEQQAAETERSTQRRSRRVVTPGGAPKAGAQGGKSSSSSKAVVSQRQRAPSGAVPTKPAAGGPQKKPKVQSSKRTAQPSAQPRQPAANTAPAQAPNTKAKRPTTQKKARPPEAPGPDLIAPSMSAGGGKQPITQSPELDIGGALGAPPAAVSSTGNTGDEPLLDFLINKANLITAEQASQARSKCQVEGIAADQACSALGFIDEEQLVTALTQECWVPHLKVDKYEIRKKALDTIAVEDARAFSVLPVDKLGSILNLAMVNPLDTEAIQVLETKTGLDIKKVVATRSEIEEGITKYYGGESLAKEGGMAIEQDLSPIEGLPSLDAPDLSAPVDLAAGPSGDPFGEIASVDDLLSADEPVKPAIVTPITIGDDELEPDVEEDELQVVGGLAPSAPTEPASIDIGDSLSPTEPAPSLDIGGGSLFSDDEKPSAAQPGTGALEAPAAATPSIEIGGELDLGVSQPAPALSNPTPAAQPELDVAVPGSANRKGVPASNSAARAASQSNPAKAATSELGLVVEEEFQHAITHGKSRVFDKWVSLQTRNRILNAVPVEGELNGLLQPIYG